MPMPHLLVIDDEAQMRRVFARVLCRSFVVECVIDAEAALAAIDGGEVFDAVLCDLHLPGMSGRDFSDQLKRRSHYLVARLVVLTGAEPAEGDAFAVELGERYLTKPCSTSELMATLSSVAFPRVSSPMPAVFSSAFAGASPTRSR